MNHSRIQWKLGIVCAALGWVVTMFTGCVTDGGTSKASTNSVPVDPLTTGRLQPGDFITVDFSGVTSPPEKFSGRIKEDGTISLPLLTNSVKATGQSIAELEKYIRDQYVPTYFNRLNVVVNSESRYYTVQGEVHNPSRQVYAGYTTVLSAIASGGGFTDFANKRSVQLIRANGNILVVNCVKALKKPDLDIEVFPLDRIYVKRRVI